LAHQRPVTAAPSSRQASLERYAATHSQFEVTSRIPQLLGRAVALSRHLDGAVIDLGCGEGGTLAAFFTVERDQRDQRDERAPLGLELSSTRAAIARRRGFAVVLGNAMRLPLRPGSVALAISRHVIEHVDNDLGAAVEIARTMVSGGVLYLETPLRLPWAWYPYRNQSGSWVLDPTHVREYVSAGQLTAVLEAAGLECRAVEVGPIRFPIGQLALRVPGASRALGRLAPRVRDLASPALAVPRYREIRVLAVKR
jgi:SAM-dependent methyltransferase